MILFVWLHVFLFEVKRWRTVALCQLFTITNLKNHTHVLDTAILAN